MLTQEQVKELFHYDAETGHLIWKVNTGRKKFIGKIAGTKRNSGYWQIGIYKKIFLVHRLVWLWQYGVFPSKDLDHINGDKSDNRLQNLREATKSENAQNKLKPHSNNKSGFLGVRKHKNKWMAQITSPKGKNNYLGYYETPEAAHAAYLAKKRELHPFGTL